MLSLDYIAGLFDGEGYFTIARVKGGNRLTVHPYRLQGYARVVIRERWLLEHVAKALGYGHVTAHKSENERHAAVASFSVSGPRLTKFCEEVGPLLLIKREQAKVMLELRRIKERVGTRSVSKADYEAQITLWAEMHNLNRKGPEKHTPVGDIIAELGTSSDSELAEKRRSSRRRNAWNRRLSDDDVIKIIDAYREHGSKMAESLACQFGVSVGHIKNLARQHGIRVRPIVPVAVAAFRSGHS